MAHSKGRSYIVRRFVLIPRRSRCIIVILLLAFFQICSIFIYSFTSSTNNDLMVLNQLDNFDFNKARTFVKGWFETSQASFDQRLQKLMKSIPVNDKKYWKFQNGLTDTLIEIPIQQLQSEQKLLSYDPRFTYSVYLNYIKKQYELKNPLNEPTLFDESKKIYVPFQWSDWVDLTLLNKYISLPELEKPNCEFLYPPKTKESNPSTRTKPRKVKSIQQEVIKDVSAYCATNDQLDAEFLKLNHLKDTSLLPGFNVLNIGPKGSVDKKRLQMKSYLYSTFDNPSSILFMANDGLYEVFASDKQMIRSSELLSSYIEDHNNDKGSITFDPVREFNDLTKTVPAQNFAGNETFDDLILLNSDLRLPLDESLFVYDLDQIVKDYEAMTTELTSKQKSHYDSLKYSTSISSMRLLKHFNEANLVSGVSKKESGSHYDWRFFNGFVSLSAINDNDDVDEKKRIILHRLLKNWLQFTYKTNLITWIAHGSLLSWYWDGISFPWDVDIDVQMPVMELDRFSLMFNNSLVVENVNEGFAKFFIDCSSNLSHRTKGNGRNNIDARFIDVDSGFYIDITGLSLTNTQVNKRYRDKIDSKKVDAIVQKMKSGSEGWENKGRKAREEAEKSVSIRYLENQSLQAYNCRNNHFYLWKELSPLRVSLIEGTKTLIPNNFKDILKLEYTRGMTVTTFNKHVYIPQLSLWLTFDKVYECLRDEVEKIHSKSAKRPTRNKRITAAKIVKLMREIDEDMLFKLLQNDDILKEYYLTSEITKLHEQEMELINSNSLDKNFVTTKIINSEFKPLRKDMFLYIEGVKKFGELKETKIEDEEAKDRKLEASG